jgi:undecaprenyl-diphosphatase
MEPPHRDPLLSRLDDADGRLLAWIATRRPGWIVAFMRVVSRTGDATTIVAVLATSLIVHGGRASALVTIATLISLALFQIGKRLCRRVRPCDFALAEIPDRFSMPSGHAACAWAIAVSLSATVPPVTPLAIAWAGLVAASRVVLGVHYPFDVVVGAAIGCVCALLTLGAFG